jgi:hypothetical protein
MRRALIALGAAVMAFAVAGALTDDDVRPVGVLGFLAGVLVWHDLLLMPAVIGVGALIGRFVPVPARTVVRVVAICSLVVLVVALPLTVGAGDRPYGWGLVLVLALLWSSALGVVVTRRVRRRRTVSTPKGRAGR